MARYPNYPKASFSASQNFLARDPAGSGQVVRVQGQSILDAAVQEILDRGDIVQAVDTLTEAKANDYESGIYVLTGGNTVTLDGGQAIYRVSDPGSGGIVMDNGNELVLLFVANTPANIITPFDSIADLPEVNADYRVSVTGYHPSTTVGGGEFVGNASARHDGVIYFDPDRSAEIGTAAYYVDSGVDVPCWERVGSNILLDIAKAGAVQGSDGSFYTQKIIDLGKTPIINGDYDWDTTVIIRNEANKWPSGNAVLQATATLYPDTANKYYFFRFIDCFDSGVRGFTFKSIDGTGFNGAKRAVNIGAASASSGCVIEKCVFEDYQSQPIVIDGIDETLGIYQPASLFVKDVTVRNCLSRDSAGLLLTLNGGCETLTIHDNIIRNSQLGAVKIDGQNPPADGKKCSNVSIKDNMIVGTGSRSGIVNSELFGFEENIDSIEFARNQFYGVNVAEIFIFRDGQTPGTVNRISLHDNKFFSCTFDSWMRASITSINISKVDVTDNKLVNCTVSSYFANTGTAIDNLDIERNSIDTNCPVFILAAPLSLRVKRNEILSAGTYLLASGAGNVEITHNECGNLTATVAISLTLSGTLDFEYNDFKKGTSAKVLDVDSTSSGRIRINKNTFPSGVQKQIEVSGASSTFYVTGNTLRECTSDAIVGISATALYLSDNTFESIAGGFRAINAEVAANASGINNRVIQGIPNTRNYAAIAAGNEF